jgi:hypothetical protein
LGLGRDAAVPAEAPERVGDAGAGAAVVVRLAGAAGAVLAGVVGIGLGAVLVRTGELAGRECRATRWTWADRGLEPGAVRGARSLATESGSAASPIRWPAS